MIKTKKPILYPIVFLLLLLGVQEGLFPYIWHNNGGVVYTESGPQVSTSINSIEEKIIKAAGFFLEGRSYIQQLLGIIEQQNTRGINSTTLDTVLTAALTNLQKSKDTYLQIIKQAERTPYNPSALTQLKNFGYDEFATTHKLNRPIFTTVKTLLKNGNITGVFRNTVQQLNTMLTLLKKIKKDFYAGQVPDIALFWKLNETAAETSLAGSYSARIFAHIK